MKPRIPKPTSGHFDRSYFFLVSRGRIRISTLRCPEVGLGILDFTFRDRTEGDIQSS